MRQLFRIYVCALLSISFLVPDTRAESLDFDVIGEILKEAQHTTENEDSEPSEPETICCPIDANGDCSTDGRDLSVLLTQFGENVTPGQGADFNGNGVVNGADLSALLANFGCQGTTDPEVPICPEI